MSDKPGIGGETFTIEFTKDSFCSRDVLHPYPIQFVYGEGVTFYITQQTIKNINLIKRLRKP